MIKSLYRKSLLSAHPPTSPHHTFYKKKAYHVSLSSSSAGIILLIRWCDSGRNHLDEMLGRSVPTHLVLELGRQVGPGSLATGDKIQDPEELVSVVSDVS